MARKSSAKKAKKSPVSKKKTPAKVRAGTKKMAKPKSARILPRPVDPKIPKLPSLGLADDPVASEIMKRLREALTPLTLLVKNLSSVHKKHKQAKKHGGGHYSLFVVSDLFTGLKPIQRQQWIHSLLDDLLKKRVIHALEMKLKDTDETSTLTAFKKED